MIQYAERCSFGRSRRLGDPRDTVYKWHLHRTTITNHRRHVGVSPISGDAMIGSELPPRKLYKKRGSRRDPLPSMARPPRRTTPCPLRSSVGPPQRSATGGPRTVTPKGILTKTPRGDPTISLGGRNPHRYLLLADQPLHGRLASHRSTRALSLTIPSPLTAMVFGGEYPRTFLYR
jgi:hypothetical protein